MLFKSPFKLFKLHAKCPACRLKAKRFRSEFSSDLEFWLFDTDGLAAPSHSLLDALYERFFNERFPRKTAHLIVVHLAEALESLLRQPFIGEQVRCVQQNRQIFARSIINQTGQSV